MMGCRGGGIGALDQFGLQLQVARQGGQRGQRQRQGQEDKRGETPAGGWMGGPAHSNSIIKLEPSLRVRAGSAAASCGFPCKTTKLIPAELSRKVRALNPPAVSETWLSTWGAVWRSEDRR